jgi:hypothetical protein
VDQPFTTSEKRKTFGIRYLKTGATICVVSYSTLHLAPPRDKHYGANPYCKNSKIMFFLWIELKVQAA